MPRLFKKTDEKTSLWTRIRQIALTDVGVLVRGLDHGSLEQLEELLLAVTSGWRDAPVDQWKAYRAQI
jgi:fused signal recognition particle receptor